MHTSLYENLYRKIALDIRTGRLEPDSKLPSIRGYAEEHAISKNTVINAYNLLLSEGYIYSKEKSGFYVSKMETGLYAEAKQNRIESEIKEDKSEPLLDLSSNLVDSTNFPYSTLRQLYREALSKTSISLLDQAGDLFGEKDLRKSIADFVYTHKGINCTYEQVVIGNGTAYHLNKIAVMFEQKGTFLMEEPTFQSTLQIIKDTGINIIQIKQDKEGINLSELKKSG
ncbi:MAG: aminotransferase class I/II-fold pyridoxal phosphate-dependent enzyme, partial [Spirochaetales bacterium]|nr:aminotransferase class I/II-fold pyridoxal phosphate-dependent enzyme [Spirochaetales bacterium]